VPGGTFTRSSKNFANYKAAITVFGVGLTNQSGASTNVTEKWKFGNVYGAYWLCGNDAFPTDSHRIYAGF
jgi:hypothetical protein